MSLSAKDRKIGIILIVIGFLFIINNFGVFDFGASLWKLLPLMLVWWGFHILRKRGKSSHGDTDFQVFSDTKKTTSSPFIRNSSAFGDIQVKVECEEFSGGIVSNVFGRISLDLTSVAKIEGYGRLDLHSVFGDIAIRIPENIAFEVTGNNLFGATISPDGNRIRGSNYQSPGFDTATNRITIKTSMIFGDVQLTR